MPADGSSFLSHTEAVCVCVCVRVCVHVRVYYIIVYCACV